MGILEEMEKNIRNQVYGLEIKINSLSEKLNKLIQEKKPQNRTHIEKPTKEALSLNDSKSVDMNIKNKEYQDLMAENTKLMKE